MCNLSALLFEIITKQAFRSCPLSYTMNGGGGKAECHPAIVSVSPKILPDSQLSNMNIPEKTGDRSVTLNAE